MADAVPAAVAYGMRAALAALAILAAGCAAPSPSEEETFALDLTPATLRYGFAGQPIVLLANLTGDAARGPVRVEATAPGAAVGVQPPEARPGTVVEVTVVPDASQAFENLTVTIAGVRGDERHEASLAFEVWDPMTPPLEHAATVREAFVAWLGERHPELGIQPGQTWVGAFARPNILVVSYYAFYSPEWEMGVRRHVMIPPYDWAEVYLRPRFVSAEPTLAYEVDSFSAEPWTEPRAVPVEGVWR